MLIFARDFAGVDQLVEHDLAKVGVAGSSPVSRSDKRGRLILCFETASFFYLNILCFYCFLTGPHSSKVLFSK